MAGRSETDSYVVEKVLAHDGGGRRQFRLGLLRAGANRFLDARIFFENDLGEMIATKKGVALTASNFLTLVRMLGSHTEEVRNWLGLSYSPEDVLADATNVASRRPDRSMPMHLTWSFFDGGRGGAPFHVEEHGGRTVVNFNSQHAWVGMRLNGQNDATLRTVAELIAAEEIARRFARFSGEDDEFEGVLELLEISRSVVLTSSRGR